MRRGLVEGRRFLVEEGVDVAALGVPMLEWSESEGEIDLASILSLKLRMRYDDGFVAYINGVEVLRAPEMPAGDPVWNSAPFPHESGNSAI